MKKKIPDISSQIYNDEILSVIEKRYSILGPMWVNQQMEWNNGIYASFKDHDKFLILIYLVKKTLDFYSRNFIKMPYDEFYSRDTVEIEKFSISEVSQALDIPKETARRKLLELENEGAIRKNKKGILIDRSKFYYTKPENSIKRISRFLALLSEMSKEEKILTKKIYSGELENIIKNNFSYIWKLYYELQIPMLINYKKIFNDLESFHIFGTCIVNQHLYAKKISSNIVNRDDFIKTIHTSEMQGLNAMSISDITGIPRATVIRKLKNLVNIKRLKIDEKKHYKVTALFSKTLLPLQKKNFNKLANFSTKIFNIIVLNSKRIDESNDISINLKKYL